MNHKMPRRKCLRKKLERWAVAILKGDLQVLCKSFAVVIKVCQAEENHV